MPKKQLESDFNKHLNSELKRRFPDSVSIKQDANVLQGVPDRLVLNGPKWAMLESKRATKAERQPNQEYRVAKFDDMSFSAFIHPENCDEVLDKLEDFFNG